GSGAGGDERDHPIRPQAGGPELVLLRAGSQISQMTIRAIDHVQLSMPAGRESEARAFYEGILGIPEVPKPAHLTTRGGCWFERGSLKVHLGVEPDFRPAKKAHPAFIRLRSARSRAAPACCGPRRKGG